jgi:hypothetical protein
MSDKELDDLFKDASGKMDTPFEASDWKKMEELLDANGGTRSAFWNWKTYTSLSLLLLLGTITPLVWMNTKEEKNDSSVQQEQVVSENALLSTGSITDHSSTKEKSEAITSQQEKNDKNEGSPTTRK